MPIHFYVDGAPAAREDAFARWAASGAAHDPADIEAVFQVACEPSARGEACRDQMLDGGVEIVVGD